MTRMIDPPADVSETPIPRVKGTADWLPDDFADLAALQAGAGVQCDHQQAAGS